MATDQKVIDETINVTLNKTAESFQSFRAFWDYLGNDFNNFIIAAAILGSMIILRTVLMRLIYNPITHSIQEKHPERSPLVIHMFKGPIQRIPMIIGLLVVCEYLNLQGPARIFVINCVYTLVTIALFWLLYNIIGLMSVMEKKNPKVFRPQIVHWVSPLLKILIIATAMINILQLWGVQVVGLLAGIGIFGLAFALGAQNLVANFLAGFNIVSENHFQLGDMISIDGTAEGLVQDIGFRTTKLKNMDMSSVYIPNKIIAERAMINNFARSHRRIFWKLLLDHNASNDALLNIQSQILSYLNTSDLFSIQDNIPTYVGVAEIKDEGIVFVIDCFTNRNERVQYQIVNHELAINARRIIMENKVIFARTRHYVSMDSDSNVENNAFRAL